MNYKEKAYQLLEMVEKMNKTHRSEIKVQKNEVVFLEQTLNTLKSTVKAIRKLRVKHFREYANSKIAISRRSRSLRKKSEDISRVDIHSSYRALWSKRELSESPKRLKKINFNPKKHNLTMKHSRSGGLLNETTNRSLNKNTSLQNLKGAQILDTITSIRSGNLKSVRNSYDLLQKIIQSAQNSAKKTRTEPNIQPESELHQNGESLNRLDRLSTNNLGSRSVSKKESPERKIYQTNKALMNREKSGTRRRRYSNRKRGILPPKSPDNPLSQRRGLASTFCRRRGRQDFNPFNQTEPNTNQFSKSMLKRTKKISGKTLTEAKKRRLKTIKVPLNNSGLNRVKSKGSVKLDSNNRLVTTPLKRIHMKDFGSKVAKMNTSPSKKTLKKFESKRINWRIHTSPLKRKHKRQGVGKLITAVKGNLQLEDRVGKLQQMGAELKRIEDDLSKIK